MIKSGTIHDPKVGEQWQNRQAEPWTITEVRPDGTVIGKQLHRRATELTLGDPTSDRAWHRVQAASPEPGHRADPAPGRTGMLALRCQQCHGTEWRRAKPNEMSPATGRLAHFVCVTCERSGSPRYLTNDVYADGPPLLAPITLKELDALGSSDGGDSNGAAAPSA